MLESKNQIWRYPMLTGMKYRGSFLFQLLQPFKTENMKKLHQKLKNNKNDLLVTIKYSSTMRCTRLNHDVMYLKKIHKI